MKQFFSFVKKAFYFLKTCLSNSIGAIGQIKNRVLDYLEKKDWRERENANTIYSLAQLEKYLAGHEVAEYCLENLYKGDIADAHRNGYLHIHDLNMGIAAYCCGFDTYLILSKGFPPAISNTACSAPPKHFSSALGQLVNFIGTVSNEIAGAVALNDFDVLLAPYLELDELSDREIYQRLQEFIYSINVPSRFSQCVDEETEVLTKDGWKKYYQLTKDDIIATLNVEKDQIEFLKVESLNVFDYEGKMIYLKNRKVEQLVTPNHRVLRQKFNYKNNKYEFNFAKDIKKFKTRIIIPLSGKTASTKKIDDNLIKLAAWIVAEGSFDRGNIRIFKSTKYPEKIKEIRTILTNLGYSFSEYVRKKEDISKHPSYINGHLVKHNYDIVSFVIHKESSNEIKKLLVREKKIPNFIKDLSSEQIKLFIDTYLNLDGDKKSRIYVSEYNKDQLQALCALCNYGCTARKKGTCWVVRITRPVAHITQVKEVNYKGKVWCPTTKNGTFVARRNGKIFITGNSPFANLTIDFTVPDYLKNLPVIAGKPLDMTYGEYKRLQALMNRINRNLLKLLIKGDSQGRPFTFPVITINITKDFKQRVPEDIQELLWEWTAYKGGGYYQNMISSDLDVSDIRSMCCRLRLDLTELKRNVGTSIGGSSPQTGSLGVVDINLPLIAQNYKLRFFQALIGYVNLACSALIKKRQVIDKLWGYGLFPYLRHYLRDFSHHFLTVSVQGAWEAWIFLGKPDNFTDFCLKIANTVKQEILKWQQKTGYLFNWEEAPAEGACYRFAKFLKNYDKQFITNGLKLPVDYSDDLYDYIEHYDKILPLFTGGSMFLIFVGEKLQPYSVWPLIRMLTYKTKIPYFAITPTFSYCPKCKCTYQGKMEKCEKCGTICEIYDRVVGYYRPTKLWNKGKREEFNKRKRFNLNNKSP